MKKIAVCLYCKKEFVLRRKSRRYCSQSCGAKGRKWPNNIVEMNCSQCGKIIYKRPRHYRNQVNYFCNRSCVGSYASTHKKLSCRVSRLEKYLQENLLQLYPKIEFHFNRRDTINSELDIYIPEHKLAFELNGILHYEPIYGEESLKKTQNNDNRKFQACLEKGIELAIIDSSSQKYVKESTSKPFLDIVVNIINMKVNSSSRT